MPGRAVFAGVLGLVVLVIDGFVPCEDLLEPVCSLVVFAAIELIVIDDRPLSATRTTKFPRGRAIALHDHQPVVH